MFFRTALLVIATCTLLIGVPNCYADSQAPSAPWAITEGEVDGVYVRIRQFDDGSAHFCKMVENSFPLECVCFNPEGNEIECPPNAGGYIPPADAAAYNIGATGEFLSGGALTGGGETGGTRFQQLNGRRYGAGSSSDSGRMGGALGSGSNGRDDQGANPFSGN